VFFPLSSFGPIVQATTVSCDLPAHGRGDASQALGYRSHFRTLRPEKRCDVLRSATGSVQQHSMIAAFDRGTTRQIDRYEAVSDSVEGCFLLVALGGDASGIADAKAVFPKFRTALLDACEAAESGRVSKRPIFSGRNVPIPSAASSAPLDVLRLGQPPSS
jgi:hypothetical protein